MIKGVRRGEIREDSRGSEHRGCGGHCNLRFTPTNLESHWRVLEKDVTSSDVFLGIALASVLKTDHKAASA